MNKERLDDLISRLPVGYALEHLEQEMWIVVDENEQVIAAANTARAAINTAVLELQV